MERRLGWVVESTVEALRIKLSQKLPRSLKQRYTRAVMNLDGFLNDFVVDSQVWADDQILDNDIRTPDARQMALAERSNVAMRWRLVTRLQTEDFVEALRAAHGNADEPD